MMTNIAFNISNYSTNYLYFELTKLFEINNKFKVFHPNNIKDVESCEFITHEFKNEKLHNFWQVKKDLNYQEALSIVKGFEKEFGFGISSLLIFSDRWFNDKSYEEILIRLGQYIIFWETFFKDNKIDYLISGGISGSYLYIAHYIAKKHICVPLYLFGSQVKGKFSISYNPELRRKRSEEIMKNINKGALDPKVKEFVDHYIENYFLKKEKVDLDHGLLKDHKFLWRFNKNNIIKFSKQIYNPLSVILKTYNQFKPSIKWGLSKKYFISRFDCKNIDYVYFPIHFQPEASTLIWAPYFENQVAVIENISKSLPASFKLVLKEHIVGLGSKPINFYKRICDLKNAALIDPFFDNFELIRHAKLIVTITGTIGWESLLLKKPVIVLGNYWMDESKHVSKVTDLTKLPESMEELLTNQYDNDHEWYKFIYSQIEGTYEGVFNAPDSLPSVLEKENIIKIYNALMQEFKYHAH